MLKLLVFASIFVTILGDCPDDFDIAHDGMCAGPVQRRSCNTSPSCLASSCNSTDLQQFKLKPVIIHSEQDQAYFTAQSTATDRHIFLGLTCNNFTQRYEWLDGSILDFKPYNNYDRGLESCSLPHPSACSSYCGQLWYIEPTTGRWVGARSVPDFSSSIFCTGQLPPLPVHDFCDDGFVSIQENEQCYKIGSPATDFTRAQMACMDIDAVLASIHGVQENSFIRQLAFSNGATNGLFIGASINDSIFEWSDGSAWDYDNTYAGYPMEGKGDCLVMDTFGAGGQWINGDCSTKLPYVCARPEPAPACSSGPWKEGDNITSPGYPFDASIACDYILSVDQGLFVQVTIEDLQANSCCDQLLLTDAKIGGKLVAALTGQIVSSQSKTFTSNSNFMRVSWQPNGGVNVKGFRMTYRAVDDKWSTTTTPKPTTPTTTTTRVAEETTSTAPTTSSSTEKTSTSTTVIPTTSGSSGYGSSVIVLALLAISLLNHH